MYEKWLRSFHAVAETGGFTAAAKQLGLSQPTITQQVRNLEDHFSVELFLRDGRQVHLTVDGEQLFQITQDMFALGSEAVGFLQAARNMKAGSLAVGTVGPAATMDLVQRYAARFPDISITLDVGSMEQIVEALNAFTLHAAVLAVQLPAPQYHSVMLGAYDVGLIVHADHPWAERSAVRVRDLQGQQMVLREASSSTQRVIDHAVERRQIEYGHVLRVTGREAAREAVLRNMGVGVVSEVDHVEDDRLRFIRIEDETLRISFFLTCLARRRRRPLISSLLELADRGHLRREMSATIPNVPRRDKRS